MLSGGTLYECGVALKSLGAASVSAFVAHSVFPNDSWKRYDAHITRTDRVDGSIDDTQQSSSLFSISWCLSPMPQAVSSQTPCLSARLVCVPSFSRGGDRSVFERFYTTNSIPTVTAHLPDDDVFVVLDLTDKVTTKGHTHSA